MNRKIMRVAFSRQMFGTRTLPFFTLSIFFLLACNQNEKQSVQLVVKDTAQIKVEQPKALLAQDIINWPRKSVVEIGCIMETEIGFRDSTFNCNNKNYINKGDPCKNTDAYYESINFPDRLAGKIHPAVQSIHLDFEGGRLREIHITFRDSVAIDTIKKWFNLPSADTLPGNIMAINYGDNVYSNDKPTDPAFTRWLTLTGFEHMGAGDVDCE